MTMWVAGEDVGRVWSPSSVTAKAAVAVSGLLLYGFLAFHLWGNLQIFAGRAVYDAYAESLHRAPLLLWGSRAGLAVAFVAHVFLATRQELRNRAARPVAYAVRRQVASRIGSRTLLESGLVVAAFVVYHLLHFTFGVLQPGSSGLVDPQGRHDVYTMVVAGFRDPLVAGFYLLALAVLAVHLAHALQSALQSLGMNHPRYNRAVRVASPALALLLFAGFASIPAACLLGLLHLPPGVAS